MKGSTYVCNQRHVKNRRVTSVPWLSSIIKLSGQAGYVKIPDNLTTDNPVMRSLVGHTHEDIDQRFSAVISQHLRTLNAMTLSQLQKALKGSFLKTQIVEVIGTLWDVKKWIDDIINNTYPHQFWKKHKKARRNSGGICVLAKNSIAKGIKKLPKNHPDILWIKLDRSFFKFDKDVYIATVYISPENSSVNVSGIEPIYNQLLADTVKYSSLGHIMLQGDFNAYTNTKPDYVTFDESKKTNLENSHYVDDKIMSRNNLDPKLINKSGNILLSLCKESGLRILNGRTIGDLHGKYTCITYNGCSVVDYVLVSNDLLKLIGLFEYCAMSTGYTPNKFIWSQEAIDLYTQNSNSTTNQKKFEEYLQTDFQDADKAVEAFTSILYENAQKQLN
ncbi:unnamed protein product [Mytilus coruscus]|uniref:DUF7869 domain-containing protein n=1 Tax=Mytilus coruscus TaxID=42192 RepID=A0A6J8AG69_MYTCO|nr:unnamed protein product [Mytilus coruscus]